MTSSSQKLNSEFKNKTILITGGSGSIGSALAEALLQYPVESIRILDIDENSLFKLGRHLDDPKIRLLLGNITDKDRLNLAAKDVDIIFHTAAIKNIEISEYNPIETISTNVIGTVNLIQNALMNKPAKFINISTDKAVNSSTLYGTTKQLGEKLIAWAGTHILSTKFATIRFGNVFESRGNVLDVWKEELNNGNPISITDPSMKRFFFHISDAANFVMKCIPLVNHGEIFVPKMKSFSIQELANSISKNQKIIGKRRGEKFEEILISEEEKNFAIEKKDMWIIDSLKINY